MSLTSVGILVLLALLLFNSKGNAVGQQSISRQERGSWASLTEEQRTNVNARIIQLWKDGASVKEIRTAVREMFQEYGVKPPEFQGEGPSGTQSHFLANLTKEQRKTVWNKIKEMENQGASSKEIRASIREVLQGYGIGVPKNQDGLNGPMGFGHGGFLNRLTDEQRQAVLERTREMRSQGASREKIKATVTEMLEEYGIVFPETTANSNFEDKATEFQIKTGNYPNPFNLQTEIVYSLPTDSYVKLTIYNIQGQKVRQLVDEYQSAGTKEVIWNGRDETGNGVASGIYFYRIQAGPNTETNCMVLLK